ncbi:MAG: hypothetical protein ACPGJV_11695, partial [Bacteriovoracaceae bacterium]
FLKISNPRTGKKLKVKSILKNGFSIISFQVESNGNRFAREYIKERFGLKRTYSINAPKDNYIPIHYRKVMKKNDVTHSMLRDLFYEDILKSIDSDIKLLIEYLNDFLEISISADGFKYSVLHSEISYDIITPLGIKLSEVSSIKENLDDLALKSSSKSYLDSQGNSISYSPLPKSIKFSLNDYGNSIEGFSLDGTDFILYTKECASNGHQNRLEQKFKKDNITKYCGSNAFDTKYDLKEIMSTLAEVTFELGIEALSKTPPLRIKGRKKVIKGYCKSFFGKHWPSAYRLLTSKNAQICTNKGSQTPKPLIPLVRKVERQKSFIRSPKRGYYKVDWRWVKSITKL